MKIIVGKFKGASIEAPRGLLSRPPLAIIRESVFNILGPPIEGKRILDLFAGSGSLGIEALSRGARQAHFVDSSKRCAKMIKRNAANLGISDMCVVTRQDALEFVRQWQREPFDVVFVDPPFLSGKAVEVLAALPSSQAGSEKTVVVVRLHWREEGPIPETYSLLRRRKFGESVVLFLERAKSGGMK
jgi:16S rRNA (guanine(966)-N(2))-methyltransferase RsmD